MSNNKKLSAESISTTFNNKLDPASLMDAAKELTDKLNGISEVIQKLEDGLRFINANFPFQYVVLKGDKSSSYKPEGRHQVFAFPAVSYTVKKSWAFSWEKDEASKDAKFRLYLVEIKAEVVCCEIGYPDPDDVRFVDCPDEVVSKKPLMQLNYAEKLQFSKYLDEFIKSFEQYLRDKIRDFDFKNSIDYQLEQIRKEINNKKSSKLDTILI